jgi:hypothetical protein
MEAWNPNNVKSEPAPQPVQPVQTHVQVTLPGKTEPLNVRTEVVQAAEQKDAEALLKAPVMDFEPSYVNAPPSERIVPSNTSNGLTPYQYAQYSMWADGIKQNTSTYPSVDQYKRVFGL